MQNSKTSTEDLINQKIKELHEKGSGDWQTITRQVAQNYKTISYNVPQMIAAKAAKKFKKRYLEWSRGTGKTTEIGRTINENQRTMIRSNGMMIAPTYKSFLTQILPSLVRSFEQQGLFKDLNYFIGRKPPKNWKWQHPYQPPDDYSRYIIFANGSGMNLISHDKSDDGRGLNTDWEIGDESALLNKAKLDSNTTPTLRGSNRTAFDGNPLWCSTLHCSSTPLTPEGQWFIDMEEAANRDPDNMFFFSCDCRFNMENLHPDYLKEAKATTLPYIYNAEYLNIRPNQIKGGFYSMLSPKVHTYSNYDYSYYQNLSQEEDCRGDADLVKGRPLTLGVDWGAAINCLIACQNLPGEFRALKSMYVLGENKEVQSDLFDKFDRYYRHHDNKTIYLYYDNSGNVQNGIDKRTRAEMARDQLRKHGWNVQLMTVGGKNPAHDAKQLLWAALLEEKHPRLPKFRMNKSNCRDLYLSMFNAKAIPGSKGEVKKDKSSERSTIILRQHATDLSDAIDAPIYGLFRKILRGGGSAIPDSTFSHH